MEKNEKNENTEMGDAENLTFCSQVFRLFSYYMRYILNKTNGNSELKRTRIEC